MTTASRKRNLLPDTPPPDSPPEQKQLPLKKRLYSDEPPSSPVDFSLPNRTRAKATPPKRSPTNTDTDSAASPEEKSPEDPLDLTKPCSAVFGPNLLRPPNFFPFPFPPPFLASSAFRPPPIHSAASPWELLQRLIQSSQGSSDSSGDEKSRPPPEERFIINPATGNRVRRNYKNMTRERRMEANARERTRVHTIGAAFDQLQKLVPSLSAEQKLSKLSILRISCKYMMLLAALSGKDYSLEQNGYSVTECVEMLNDTIAAEGKVKRR